MTPSRWLILFFIGLILSLSCVAAFNAWMDPYYFFDLQHRYNNRLDYTTEPYRKNFYLKKHGQEYDEFLIGSSTAALLDVSKVIDHKIFNYGISSHSQLDIPKTLTLLNSYTKKIKRIYICFDLHDYANTDSMYAEFPDLVADLDSPLFKARSLIGVEMLSTSITSFLNNFRSPISLFYFDYNFVPHADSQEPNLVNPKHLLARTRSKADFEKALQEIPEEPGVEYVVFTSPMAETRLRFYYQNVPNYYSEWLRLLVDRFGKVYHFAYNNPYVSEKAGNFYTGNHFYIGLGDKMLYFLTNPEKSSDFGVILDRSNIDSFLQKELLNFKDKNKSNN